MRLLSTIAILLMTGGCTRGNSPRAIPIVPASSDRAAFLAGASGEVVQPNFFVEDLRGLSTSLAKRGWQIHIAAASKDEVLRGSVRASNAQLLEGTRRTLESVKPGGQALLVFHSHGRQRESRWGQKSHSIVSEERDESGIDIGFDLDSVEPELLKAQSRGVRVGLVDLSCYSGAIHTLKGAACTVSLAAVDYVSLCSGREEERAFNSHFFKIPAEPVSLEAQFLEARRKDIESINLPQISSRPTPALAGWENFLKEADPLDTYEELKNLQAGATPFDARRLLKDVDLWIAGQKAPREFAPLRGEIAKRLEAVAAIRKQLEGEIAGLAKDYDLPALTVELEGNSSLKIAPASLAEALESIEALSIPEGYTDVQHNLLKKLEPWHDQLVSRHAEPLAQYRARRDRFDQLADELAAAAGALFESERKLYDRQVVEGGSNPCREFVL